MNFGQNSVIRWERSVILVTVAVDLRLKRGVQWDENWLLRARGGKAGR
jgi:hypothetical protein